MEDKSIKTEKGNSRAIHYATGVVLALLGLTFIVYTLSQNYATDSKMIPLFLSGLTVLISIIYLFAVRKGSYEGEVSDFSSASRVLWLIVTLAVYVLGNYFIGYYISTAIFLAYVMWSLGYRNKKVIIGVSVILPVLIYIFFERLFTLKIPHGILFEMF